MKRAGRNGRTRKPRSEKRSWVERWLLGEPKEQSTEYVGFFALPRATHHSSSQTQPVSLWRQVLSHLKFAGMLIISLGMFVGALAYFFAHVAPQIPEAQADPIMFVSDPQSLPTNAPHKNR